MTRHALLLCFGWWMVATACQATASWAQDGAQNVEEPSLAAKELAAFRALRDMIASRDYRVSPELVEEVVLAHLRGIAGPPPKAMPSPDDLRTGLDVDFASTWQDMIAQTAAGLDPAGELKFAARLEARLQRDPRLRTEAESRHKEFLEQNLPQTLDRVGQEIVARQSESLRKALEELVTAGRPGADAIATAFAADRRAVTDVLTREVVDSLPTDLRDVILVGSYEQLTQSCADVVADGVGQLEEQLQVFQQKTAAVSQRGLQQEFQRRLQTLAGQQQARRAEDPLRPAYGVFPRVTNDLPQEARRGFDRRVDEAGRWALRAFDGGQLLSPEKAQQDATTLEQIIRNDVAAHHRLADSRRLLQPAIAELVSVGREWITTRIVSAFAQSQSPDDADATEEMVRQDALRLLDAQGTLSHASWLTLQKSLQQRLEREVLPAVRTRIRDEQANRHAPQLTRGGWLPTEADLDDCPLPLGIPALVGLPVWTGSAPLEREVLEETWQLWREAAEAALLVTENARKGQFQVVDTLSPTIVQAIRQEPPRAREAWESYYQAQAESVWRSEGTTESTRYPDLFQSVRDRITTIVVELLQVVEQAPIAEPPMTDAPAEPDLPEPVLDPRDSAERPESIPPVETESPADAPRDGGPLQDTVGGGPTGGAEGDALGGDAGSGGGDEAGTAIAEGMDEGGGGDAAQEEMTESDESNDTETDEAAEQTEGMHATPDPAEAAGDQVSPPDTASWLARFYRIGFWILVLVIVMMACGWYWHVRYLQRLLAQYRRTGPLEIP